MPITPSQLSSILRVKKEFNLINGNITLTDLTNWAGENIIAPDTASVLLKLVSPTGAVVYQNIGYDTNNFGAPDFTLATSVLNETMPQDVNGNYITGTYTLYTKAQVVDDGDTVNGSATTTAEVCDCTATISIDIDVDYATAVLTSTDTTQYGAYFSLSRTHTIYPPPISGLPSQSTNATTNVYSNIVTTTWSVEISSNVTYLKANDTYTTCNITGSKEVVVEADTLCNTLCLIKKFRSDFYAKYGKKCVDDMEKAYNLAMDEFYLAFMATRCGRPQSEIQGYINKIYEITGLDPDCDCGCNAGEYPTPVVPTSIINGTNGTNGVTPQFQNTGTWIQVSYDEGDTWNNLFSLASVTGAAGANGTNGTNGADGVAVLYNEFPAQVTTTNSTWETLKTYTVPAAQLDSNGSDLEILATFTTSSWTTAAQNTRITFNGSTIISPSIYAGFYSRPITKVVISARITRTSNTTAKTQVSVEFVTSGYVVLQKLTQPILSLAGLNFTTTTYDIDADAYSAVNGDITLENLEVIYYKK